MELLPERRPIRELEHVYMLEHLWLCPKRHVPHQSSILGYLRNVQMTLHRIKMGGQHRV